MHGAAVAAHHPVGEGETGNKLIQAGSGNGMDGQIAGQRKNLRSLVVIPWVSGIIRRARRPEQ